MRLFVHDGTDEEFKEQFKKIKSDDIVLSNNGKIKPCVGCFDCWVKTPGICVIQDGYNHIAKLFTQAKEIIVISRCVYGGYSPFIKNVFDRSLGSLLPTFEEKDGEMRHLPRAHNSPRLFVYFYGKEITENERDTAMKLISKNKQNFHFSSEFIHFYEKYTDIGEHSV